MIFSKDSLLVTLSPCKNIFCCHVIIHRTLFVVPKQEGTRCFILILFSAFITSVCVYSGVFLLSVIRGPVLLLATGGSPGEGHLGVPAGSTAASDLRVTRPQVLESCSQCVSGRTVNVNVWACWGWIQDKMQKGWWWMQRCIIDSTYRDSWFPTHSNTCVCNSV